MPYSNNRAHSSRRLRYLLPVAVLALGSCVSGAPTLNEDQEHRLAMLTVYPLGQLPPRPYKPLANLTAADCSGAPWGGRVRGNVDRALETLKRKAAAINADSMIDVSCGAAPLLNNCGSAQKCTGRAVSFSDAPPN